VGTAVMAGGNMRQSFRRPKASSMPVHRRSKILYVLGHEAAVGMARFSRIIPLGSDRFPAMRPRPRCVTVAYGK
jgi:hypothetical protein